MAKKNKIYSVLYVLFILAVCFITYLYFNFHVNKEISLTETHPFIKGGIVLQDNLQVQKCQFDPIDPFRPDIVEFVVNKTPTLSCHLHFLPEITFLDGNILRVDPSLVGLSLKRVTTSFSHCRYRSIFIESEEDSSILFSNWSKPFSTSVLLEEDTEFIQVKCFEEPMEENVLSKSYHTLVPRRRHLEKLYEVRLNKRQVLYQPKETLSIIMVGLDGLSRHQFMRTMPTTFKYLTEDLGSFDFTMHGQHGNRTVPNFIPLLTGNLRSEVEKWWNESQPRDAYGFIFHDFEKAGFRTMYSEDHPETGLYNKPGYFARPITTYRTRPLHIAMFNDAGFVTRNDTCVGARSITELQLDYLLRFVDTFKAKPHFAFSFSDAITHDDTVSAGMIDRPIADFFKSLVLRGHLDNSLLIFFSDHGVKWGKVRQNPNGRVEGRNPFLFLRFPPWFLQKYPEVAENLEANTQVLTSHLDTYQMLSGLLYFKSEAPLPFFRTSKGISLLEKLPPRTCSEAYTPEFECLCKQWDEIPIDSSSLLAMELANVLLHEVRSRSHKTKCEEYILSEVTSVNMLKGYKGNFDGEQKESLGLVHYLVQLVALPGPAVFEGIVHFDPELSKQHSVYHRIERLNLYRTGKMCLPDEEMNFCFCK